ncbi:hypothetical protein GALL_486840 [mine drainage metagenome]|uniref:Uncharacterized protein n=1 Tax=mine drainage metagenome TaxID=410659 RepID=A0A1J5PFZ9_9ZZZZ
MRLNAYSEARNSSLMMRSASAWFSASKPWSRVLVLAAAINSNARSGAGTCAPAYFLSAAAFPDLIARSQFSAGSVWSLRAIVVFPLKTCATKATECSRKSAGEKAASAIPKPRASLPDSILLLFNALAMITCTAASGPIRRGSRYAPPQPGTSPKKTSGRATVALDAMVR